MKVIIRRRQPQENLPKQVRAEAKKNLGSHFVGQLPLNPLTETQTKKWMPGLIGLPSTHQDFPLKVREFWAEMSIKVPFEGAELDISIDDNKNPFNLLDYLKYLWAQQHITCAASEEEMRKDPRKTHYIFNPQKDVLEKNEVVQIGKRADKAYIKDMADEKKVNELARVLLNIDPSTLSPTEKENSLYTLKNADPKQYIEKSEDKNLPIKAEIIELVAAKIINKIGSQYYYEEQILGTTLKETVAFMRDEARNSKLLLEMRAALKQLVG